MIPGEPEAGWPEAGPLGDATTDALVEPPRDTGPVDPPKDCGDGVVASGEQCDDGNNNDADGCGASCTKEAGFNCPSTGGACAFICGDGLLVAGEGCDDLNGAANDGCGETCQVEQGWSCLGSGAGSCSASDCGDGLIAGAESCDDGNMIPGDGCSTTCTVEAGWLCAVAGSACAAERCGDNIRAGAELCDDGETDGMPRSGDGCTEGCDAVEPNFSCPPMGGACTRTSVCGNGQLTSDEECDDRNTNSGDGCSSSCETERGWECLAVGRECTAAACGDGVIAGSERCEDGNGTNNDGCSACRIDAGWVCDWTGGKSVCKRAVCGNQVVEAEESCDDGNDIVGDDCSPGCKLEPRCTVGNPCTSQCGDGIRLATDINEECDDGNKRDGDGCSSTCRKEAGYICRDVRGTYPETFPLTVVYRDFIARPTNGGTRHPDFEANTGGGDATLGLVGDMLVDGKPSYTGICQQGSTLAAHCGAGGSPRFQTTSAANFAEWYSNGSPASMRKLVTTMTMTKVPGSDSGGRIPAYRNPTFGTSLFPLDNRLWGVSGSARRDEPSDGHNFGFTTEIHQWFEFRGGEVLTFSGDDDVWVFIGGKLALDLGGLHPQQSRTITLNANGTVSCTSGGATGCGGVPNLGLTVGNVYEMALFHAERHTNASNFNLTLTGFNAPISECDPVCGDGVVTSDEYCDEGSACVNGSQAGMMCINPMPQSGDPDECPGGSCTSNNTGLYGHCNGTCDDLGPHCGDGAVQEAEQCDNGYAQNSGNYNGCTPDCMNGPRCGDGNVDGYYGEQCDLGTAMNTGGYGGCADNCRFSERCGDGVVQAEHEACDDGMNRSGYGGCAPGCVLAPSCGDGVIQSARGEQCDDGTANNDGRYGGCTALCRKAPRCGDRVVDGAQGEVCDDGNLNDFDGCSGECQWDFAI